MKTSKRRGFTIVELVIVIAVIAILAGVLIPTFSSIVKKANEASDTTLIKSLNTSLKAAEAIDGAKPATMHDALEATKADGYDVSKIKATASGNQILWDSVNNCFAYLKDGAITYIPESNTTTVEKHQLWSIAQVGETLSTTYSNYLAEGFTGTVTASTGVDVGNNVGVNVELNTSLTATLVVRTNGGELTVTAANANVHHYGIANTLNIIKVPTSSYHEFGTAIFAKISSGRIVLEGSSSVGSIFIPSDSTDEVIVASSGSKQFPSISAGSDGKSVTIQTLGADGAQTGSKQEIATNKTEKEAKNEAASVVTPKFDDSVVACIGWKGYPSLIDAIDAVGVNKTSEEVTTIKLVKNAHGSGLATYSKKADGNPKNITIDFNGFTYTVDSSAVGSTNTENQAMHWCKDSSIKMMNGKFVVSEEAAKRTDRPVVMAMQNYSNFTAENMVFDFSNIAVGYYEQYSEESGWQAFSGLECPLFNANEPGGMILRNCEVYFPEDSTKGMTVGLELIVEECKIHGFVAIISGECKIKDTEVKGVVSYFTADQVMSSTSEGYTVYKLAE